MKKLLHFICMVFMTVIMLFQSCTEETDRPTWPLSALIFHSIQNKQVAFTALTHSAISWSWDFGDGNTSTEKDPVHVYDEGGYYLATLTAKDQDGNSVTKSVTVAVALTPYAMLTGDHTAPGYQGKTWKLSGDHPTGGDYFANANAGLTTVSGTPRPLPSGIFSTQFGMGAIYDDTYTFHYDGKYVHDVKADGGAFSGYVYQLVAGGGQAGIINPNGAGYGLCIARYTPDASATFSYVEEEDFAVPSVYGPGGVLTFENVSTLNFSGTEFVGFRDFQRKVILRSISDTRMQLIMFMAASAPNLPLNTHALILSFEVVR